jgi:heat shock protein HtpX
MMRIVNNFKIIVLLSTLTLLLIFIGRLIGGPSGMLVAFLLAVIINFVSYWFSNRIVLMMYGAKPVNEVDAPDLFRVIRSLTRKAGLPMPRVYIIPIMTPNAFATGRDPSHAAVAVTQGILKMMDESEIEGVLAHEMAHVRNSDILLATIVATIAGAISMIANMARWMAIFGGSSGRDSKNKGGNIISQLFLIIVAPIAALLIQLAISRSCEYRADEAGGRISHNPLALASALEKLHFEAKRLPMVANPATAHMFIVNPLTGGGILSLFSTHPPIEKRIERLKRLSKEIA